MTGSRTTSFSKMVSEFVWPVSYTIVLGLLIAVMPVAVPSPPVPAEALWESGSILRESGIPFPWYRELYETQCSQLDCNTGVQPSIYVPFLVYDFLFYFAIGCVTVLVYKKVRR